MHKYMTQFGLEGGWLSVRVKLEICYLQASAWNVQVQKREMHSTGPLPPGSRSIEFASLDGGLKCMRMQILHPYC